MRRGAALVVLFFSSRALALDPQFGARGQVVVTQNASADVSWTGYDSGATFFYADLAPSIDWFAFRNVSFGMDGLVGYTKNHAFDANGFLFDYQSSYAALGLRAAVNVPFTRWVSLWPRATLSLSWTHFTYDEGVPSTATTMGTELTLYAPLLFHLRSHFFLGFGPAVSHTFNSTIEGNVPIPENTTLSLHSVIGGTFGGERSARDDEVPVPWKPFGEEHETVIGGSAAWSDVLVPNGPSTWGATLWAGVDYFAMQHVSVGVTTGFSYSNATNALFTQEQWNVYLGPQVGYDIAISPRFSFYPRAALGFAASSSDVRSGNADNSSLSLIVYVSAYAPLLFHVAPHFFLGFGPTIYRELVDKNPRYTVDSNSATRVGVAFSVGGWL